MNDIYYQRYVSGHVAQALLDTPVIFIKGPRQAGKTTLVRTLIHSDWEYINLDDQTQLTIATADPVGFIRNLTARHVVIDEVQRLPELLLAIKQSVDEKRQPGRFLLTGSANALVLPKVLDSLAGRIETIHLDTLSECEINSVKPSFLSTLTINYQAPHANNIRIKQTLIKRIVMGCFPEPLQRDEEKRIQAWYRQYMNALVQKDVKELDQIDHPEKMAALLNAAAYYSGKLINFSKLGCDLGLDVKSIKKYLDLFMQLFLVKKIPAWHTNEYKRLIKTPKLYLADTGLICAMRRLNSEYLLNHPGELGFLVETFVINELQKQAHFLDEDLSFYHYRDKDKVEVDCIIENSKGDCFGIEVKSKATLSSKDFEGLLRFKKIAGERFKMGVLLYDGDHTTAFGEGLFAVPIGALWS